MKLIIFTDGGSRGNPGPAGVGVYVLGEVDDFQKTSALQSNKQSDQQLDKQSHKQSNSQKVLFKQALYIGRATNNEAEYKAFLLSLDWLEQYFLNMSGVAIEVSWFLDSKLVVEQLNKHWKIKELRLKKLADQCWTRLAKLTELVGLTTNSLVYQLKHIKREYNKEADWLVNQALDER